MKDEAMRATSREDSGYMSVQGCVALHGPLAKRRSMAMTPDRDDPRLHDVTTFCAKMIPRVSPVRWARIFGGPTPGPSSSLTVPPSR